MIKVLFLIHDLCQGGAEKVLVNLVNNMDYEKFDITVMVMFGGGINEQFLDKRVHFKAIFPKMIPGNSKIMKLFSPEQLHKMFIKEKYDIEISYLEGPCARVISGCRNENTKLIAWIHVEQHNIENLAATFRNSTEAKKCYNKFEKVICVSQFVKQDFISILQFKKPCEVLYNTVESKNIIQQSKEPTDAIKNLDATNLVAVGTLKVSKGYDRLFRVIFKLKNEGYNVHLYVLGVGSMQPTLEKYISDNQLENVITLLGYDINPYRYVAKCDLFVCASHTEGFSTAATESLIVGTPVCTVEVSGMKEMLGENDEYGIVTENSEEGLYRGIKKLLDCPELLQYYKKQAIERGKKFDTESTVKAVEEMLEKI